MSDAATHDNLPLNAYDFIDFGCSKGGSIAFARRTFGVERGVGIDISQAKVDQARAAGFEAACMDARALNQNPRAVSFVTMVDFLEHLPSVRDAAVCIASGAEVARDFIFIRQPWFDADGYLFSLGLKLYWSDWQGHPNAMTTLEMYTILSRIPKVKHFRIYGRGLVKNSDDPAVHPLTSPIDQHDWSEDKHPPKPSVAFDRPIYRQIVCIAALEGGGASVPELEARTPFDAVIFDSAVS
jgi:hypothetical protein